MCDIATGGLTLERSPTDSTPVVSGAAVTVLHGSLLDEVCDVERLAEQIEKCWAELRQQLDAAGLLGEIADATTDNPPPQLPGLSPTNKRLREARRTLSKVQSSLARTTARLQL